MVLQYSCNGASWENLESLEMDACLYKEPLAGKGDNSEMGYRGRYSRVLGNAERIVDNGVPKNAREIEGLQLFLCPCRL